MTTRNFRVNNGLEVGNVTVTASTNAVAGISSITLDNSSAPASNPVLANKKYVDDQIAAISTTTITEGNSSVDVDDSGGGAGSVVVTVDGTAEMTIATGTITNVGKITLDNTTAPDADAVLANKKYVDDQIAAISTTAITQLNSNVTVADSGSNGTVTVTCDGNAEVTITDTIATFNGNVRVVGDLTVDGTNTIINTSTLSVEDNIIELNRNISSGGAQGTMPVFTGLKVNRGELSTATQQDIFWVWDEGFADDGTTIHGNAGGAWTALRSQSDTGNLNEDDLLVDMRCNVLHALSTSAQYADIGERFEADAPMAEGAVVMVGGDAEITEADSDLSDTVFGVISKDPAYAMNVGAGNSDSHPFVAMTGRTPVRVTGAVTKGQRLVSSSVKGTARAVAIGEEITPFHVIGRALEDKADAGIGLVNCVVRTNN